MQNKKLFSIIAIAVLTLSMLTFAVPALALSNAPALSVATGPVGTQVTVSGTGASPFSTVTIYWDSLSGQVLGSGAADAAGAYSNIKVKIPSATTGAHYIVANDGAGAQGTTFTVTQSVIASTTPKTSDLTYNAKVLPGDSLTLTGHGFKGLTSGVGATITVTLTSTTLATPNTITITTPTITTNATGSWTATITIPASMTTAQYDAYTVSATDGTNTATAPILINYYATTSPTTAPVGVTVNLGGRIQANQAFTVTLTGPGIAVSTLGTGTSSATGAITFPYSIQTILVAGNTYTLTATWGTPAQTVAATFAVGATPTVAVVTSGSVVLPSAVSGAKAYINAANFVAGANVTLSFGSTIVNSTVSDSRFGPTTGSTSATPGSLTLAEFIVPALAPGLYTVTLSDEYGASATTTFTINAQAVTTITTAPSFVQGDTISFTIKSTDVGAPTPFSNVRLTIQDPSGAYWFGTAVVPIVWTPVFTTAAATSLEVPFQAQVDTIPFGNHLMLPANAPTGSWNWTIIYDSNVGLNQKATALFTVNVGGTSGVTAKLDTIQTSINNIQGNLTAVSGDVAIIKTSVGTSIATSVSNLGAQITQVQNSIASISAPNLGSITASLSSLDAKITALQTDSATIKTSVGTITASLDDIGAAVCLVDENVVSIQTSIGTVVGNITALNGNVATIQTSLGTLQVDVTAIKGDVAGLETSMSSVQEDVTSSTNATNNLSPLVIVAIVLALIAAIAAIASIVLMRRKIAG